MQKDSELSPVAVRNEPRRKRFFFLRYCSKADDISYGSLTGVFTIIVPICRQIEIKFELSSLVISIGDIAVPSNR